MNNPKNTKKETQPNSNPPSNNLPESKKESIEEKKEEKAKPSNTQKTKNEESIDKLKNDLFAGLLKPFIKNQNLQPLSLQRPKPVQPNHEKKASHGIITLPESDQNTPKEPEKKISKLKEAIDIMNNRIDELNSKIESNIKLLDNYKAQMKKLGGIGSQFQIARKKSLMLLKQNKMYEAQVDKLFNEVFALEQIQFKQEQMEDNIQVANVIKEAKERQQEMLDQHAEEIENLEEMKEQMEELMLQDASIQEILNKNYDVPFEEGEFNSELEQLDEEIIQEKFDEFSVPNYLPEKILTHEEQIIEEEAEEEYQKILAE